MLGTTRTAVTQAKRHDIKSDFIEPFMEFSSCKLDRRGSLNVQFGVNSCFEAESSEAFMAFLAAICPPEGE